LFREVRKLKNIRKSSRDNLQIYNKNLSFLESKKINSLTIQQINDSLGFAKSFNKEMKETTILWLYDALKLYADDNWESGNQEKICKNVSLRFDQKYGGYWDCLASDGYENIIYAYLLGEAYIRYDLPNKLSFVIFKPSSNRGK
jgi:hypothetical protein